jgi:hypothetical protein
MGEIRMRRCRLLAILYPLVCCGLASGDDGSAPQPAPAGGAGATKAAGGEQAAASGAAKSEEAKLLAAVREALERNTQELKALKEQYARDMAEQKKKVEAQQKQIETLERSAQVLQDRFRSQAAAIAAPGAQNTQAQDRQKLVTDLEHKKIGLLEEQVELLADELEQQGPAIEKLQSQTATLESRAKQAARRDLELADQADVVIDQLDAERRDGPQLPATLKGLFAPFQTTSSPITIINNFAVRYDLFTHARGAGVFEFQEFTPFFLIQLNRRILLSGELIFAPSGVALGQAQADIFINDWLTVDIGAFLAPIGFWSERLDPEWINKLPDQPLVMRQVIPDGLTLTGVQFRGAKYLFGSPVKMEYSVWAADATGVPGMGKASDWADLGALTGTTASINNGMTYGARVGIWLPTRGINFGVSEIANAPYFHAAGAITSIWQPYFNYHRGNWDFRFEYGQNYERTIPFFGNSIERNGFYTQIAYRDYKSIRKHLQRLEYVFRFSDARFRGINQEAVAHNVSSFATPIDAPVDRNQYTFGVNYYLFPATVFKIAYEINQELHRDLKANVVFMQFATNF